MVDEKSWLSLMSQLILKDFRGVKDKPELSASCWNLSRPNLSSHVLLDTHECCSTDKSNIQTVKKRGMIYFI